MTTVTNGLAAKIAAAMGEIGRVKKRGQNEAQKYAYARADDVAEMAREVLSKHGIAVFASVEDKGIREIQTVDFKGNTKTHRISKVEVTWTFRDAETGEEKAVTTPGEGMDSGDKGIYKAMTGAMKYALMLGFLIPTGDGDPEVANDLDRDEQEARQPASRMDALKSKVAKANGKGDIQARVASIVERFAMYGYDTKETRGAQAHKILGHPFNTANEADVAALEAWLNESANGNINGAAETLGAETH